MPADHGTNTRYRDGCRCRLCRDVHAAANRRFRANKATGRTDQKASVISLPSANTDAAQPQSPDAHPVMGGNEKAVRDKFARLDPDGDYAVERESAIALAQMMDDPGCMDKRPQVSKQLAALCSVLTARKRKTGNRLAAVSAMSRMERRAAQ